MDWAEEEEEEEEEEGEEEEEEEGSGSRVSVTLRRALFWSRSRYVMTAELRADFIGRET